LSDGVSCTSYCKCEVKEHCVNGHTKKIEHAVEMDEEEELDEPLEERNQRTKGRRGSGDWRVIRHSAKC